MKKAIFIVIVGVLFLIIYNLIVSIYTLWHKEDLLTKAQKELEAEKLKNEKIKRGLTYAESPQFVEEEARNKLFLVKPGEQEVLIPKNLLDQNNRKNEVIPNWKKWLQVFF